MSEARFSLSLTLLEADSARLALQDWLPQQARHVLEVADERFIANDPDWTETDDFATRCEHLAAVARLAARLGQLLACGRDDHDPLRVAS